MNWYIACVDIDSAANVTKPRRNAVARTTHTANALRVTTLQMMEKNDVGAKEGNIETPEKNSARGKAEEKEV